MPEPEIEKFTITMTEKLTYRHTFELPELAALLDIRADHPYMRGEVIARLSEGQSNYGLANKVSDDESLLNEMITRGVTAVEDRTWTF